MDAPASKSATGSDDAILMAVDALTAEPVEDDTDLVILLVDAGGLANSQPDES